jgi:hypothetical protein
LHVCGSLDRCEMSVSFGSVPISTVTPGVTRPLSTNTLFPKTLLPATALKTFPPTRNMITLNREPKRARTGVVPARKRPHQRISSHHPQTLFVVVACLDAIGSIRCRAEVELTGRVVGTVTQVPDRAEAGACGRRSERVCGEGLLGDSMGVEFVHSG